MEPTRSDRTTDDQYRLTSPLVWEAFEEAPALIAVVGGPDHVFEYANRAYRDLVGDRRLIGLPAREALPEYEGQGFIELLDTVRSSREPYVGAEAALLVRREPDGPLVERFVDFVYQPLLGPDGSVFGVLAQGVDATDRVLAHRALRESEERYRGIFDQEVAGVVIIGLDGRVTSANPRFCEIVGHPEAALVGTSIRDFTHPDHVDETLANFGRLVAEGAPFTLDKRYVREDGMAVWASSTVALVHDAAGRPRSAVALTVDISERKRAEAEIRALNETLERRVAERTREVRDLAARLTVAEQEERQRIAHILHDDLQQQLYGLSIALSLLAREPLGEAARAFAEQATRIAAEATEMARSLATELSPAILQAHRLGDILDWLAKAKQAKYGIDIDVEVRGDPHVADPALRILLYQLLRELLFNVVKHSGATRARLAAWTDGGYAVVRVEDDGAGFDVAAVGEGRTHGFGLSSVRERLALVGGRSEIDSAPGSGTRVTLSVPSGGAAPG